MGYRIVQWATGNVGRHALRMIVGRPDFELVGLRVYDPAKVGVDAGHLLGLDATAVIATDDTEAILAIDADCVCYNALGTTLNDSDPLDDICRLLASGKNVVSSAAELYTYVRPGVSLNPDGYERLIRACNEGQTSFYVGGISPGFVMDQWPISVSRLCRRIDHLRVTEIVDCSGYRSSLLLDAMGFGLPPDAPSPLDHHLNDVKTTTFYLSMRMLADAIGVELDDVVYSREAALADRAFPVATGTVEAGTVAAQRLQIDGIVHGKPRITFEWVWRLTDNVAPEWPLGGFRWLMRVDGDPTVESEISLATKEDAGRPTSLASAALLLNAVPAVCEAPPGVVDNLTLSPHGGGYFLPTGHE